MSVVFDPLRVTYRRVCGRDARLDELWGLEEERLDLMRELLRR
ncbi:MAG: hypothetical protein WD492_09940 [Alkalispirochaeta sp.]